MFPAVGPVAEWLLCSLASLRITLTHAADLLETVLFDPRSCQPPGQANNTALNTAVISCNHSN
jgi:hypothetical protein